MFFSNFTTVISTSDGSLWVIGLGEGDRNCVITPVQVQCRPPPGSIYLDDEESDPILVEPNTDNPSRESTDPSVTDKRPEPEYYVASSSSTVLRKGHQRVIVLLEDASDKTHSSVDMTTVSCVTKVYEVILHNYEAFLLPVTIDFDPSCEPSVAGQRYRVKDYSTGWMHTVTLIETVGE